MNIQPPGNESPEKITLNISEIEAILQGPPLDVEPFVPRLAVLSDREGGKRSMLIRAAKREEATALLGFFAERFLAGKPPENDPGHRSLAGARLYTEILGWYRNRVKDPFILLGLCGGELAAVANGRFLNQEIAIAFHTLFFLPGFRASAAMNFAFCQYCFEELGRDEIWAACESVADWESRAVEAALPSYPWPDLQHELGGGRVYYLTRKYWESALRDRLARNYNIRIDREVPRDLLEENESLGLPGLPEATGGQPPARELLLPPEDQSRIADDR